MGSKALVGAVIAAGTVYSALAGELPDVSEIARLAREDAAVPVAPGRHNISPFWNRYSVRFISVPAFDFKEIKGAACYRFTVLDAASKVHIYTEARPDEPLSKVWDTLPVGFTTVSVEALDKENNVLQDCGVRKFYRAAVFNGQYPGPVRDYRESAKLALEYIFNKPQVQSWRTTGKPDHSYDLYCYPSKIIASIISGMIRYAQLVPEKRAEALEIACKSADYLISVSQAAGTPLEFMPPTYEGKARTAGTYAGQNMMIYPALAGVSYLELYQECGDRKYLEAALRIADTYCKLQLECGSWYLKLHEKDGSVVKPAFNEVPIGIAQGDISALSDKPNMCVPNEIIPFLQMAYKVSSRQNYRAAADRAVEYIRNNVQKSFDWSGQFEDMFPTRPYANLTMHSAADFALYLLGCENIDAADKDLLRTLLRFSEDQFVVWSDPMPAVNLRSRDWKLPGALEQYAYYIPIGNSASKMLGFYAAMHKRFGMPLDLAKAYALANAVTRGQHPETGRYYTYWENNWRSFDDEGWINCAVFDATMMLQFADYIEKLKR